MRYLRQFSAIAGFGALALADNGTTTNAVAPAAASYAATSAAGLNIVSNPGKTAINSQVHLAYAGSTGMTVSWNTLTQVKTPTVKYGLTPKSLIYTATSSVSVTYNTSLTYNNHVKVTGLKPDTVYYYQPIPLLKDNTTSLPYQFRTARSVGDGTPYSVAVVVDMGTMGPLGLTTFAGDGVSQNNVLGPFDHNTIQSLDAVSDQYDFLWQPGDMAYADSWLKEEIQNFLPMTNLSEGIKVYEDILNTFYDQMTPITTQKPFMVGAGNHESNCIAGSVTDPAANITYNSSICMPGQNNFTGFINHYRMPSDESGGTGNFWYSFDHGMVHYVQLDTETDLGYGFPPPGAASGTGGGPFNSTPNAQATWLEQDLASVDRSKTPWIIVTGHRPWYLSYPNVTKTICWSCKDVFEPLFLKYDVDLYFSGHAHVYQRSAPIANQVIDPNELNNPSAPWYITNGAGGHYDGLDSLQRPPQPYERFGLDTNEKAYGWSMLTFHNCTHLTHDFVLSANGSVLDSATLYKNRTCAVTCGKNGKKC